MGPGRDANKDVMADQMPVPLYEVLGEAFFFGGCGAALCDLSSSARDIHSWMRAPMSWRPSGEVSPLVWGEGLWRWQRGCVVRFGWIHSSRAE